MARNTGIKLSSGKYLIFLDDDDFWFSNFLFEVKKVIDATNADFIFSYAEIRNEYDMKIGYTGRYSWVNTTETKNVVVRYFMRHFNPIPSFTAIKRDLVLKTCGFDPKQRVANDVEFFMRIIPLCQKICFIDKPLGAYTITPNSIVSCYTKGLKSSINRLKALLRAFIKNYNIIEKYIKENFPENAQIKLAQVRINFIVYAILEEVILWIVRSEKLHKIYEILQRIRSRSR